MIFPLIDFPLQGGESLVRFITQSDLSVIAEIESEIHSHPWTQNMFHDCFKSESGDLGYVGFVLEISNKISAYLVLQIILDECHILTIGVEKKYQNQGYATQLLQYLFQYLSLNHCKRILLEARESNQSAVHLYTKLGFRCIAQRKNYYIRTKNDFENALILEKIIKNDII